MKLRKIHYLIVEWMLWLCLAGTTLYYYTYAGILGFFHAVLSAALGMLSVTLFGDMIADALFPKKNNSSYRPSPPASGPASPAGEQVASRPF